MAKTATVKKVKLKPFQKMLNVMITGKSVSKEEFETLLGDQIQMYRISTYIWHMKTNANAVVKVLKEGRKAVGYQICNVSEVKEYLKRSGTLLAKTTTTKPQVEKLADLEAEQIQTQVEQIAVNEVVEQVGT
jgi:DUF1009 family protein